MNTETITAKFRQYPVAFVAVGVSILLIVGLYVRSMGMADLAARQEKLASEWETMEKDVFKNSVNLETHLEKADAISQDVRKRLIRSSELAKNYQYFYRLESSTGVRISSLQQETSAPPPPRRQGGDGSPPAPALFSKVGYKMSVKGQFSELLDLLKALEDGEHFYQLKTFSLQRNTDSKERQLSLTLNFDLLGNP